MEYSEVTLKKDYHAWIFMTQIDAFPLASFFKEQASALLQISVATSLWQGLSLVRFDLPYPITTVAKEL